MLRYVINYIVSLFAPSRDNSVSQALTPPVAPRTCDRETQAMLMRIKI